MNSPEPFNPVHPPLMTDPDIFPESPTESAEIGEDFIAGKEYFDLVFDPGYPWQTMPHSTPDSFKKWKEMKDRKLAEVDHYVVKREQNWTRLKEEFFPDDTDETWSYKCGTTITHEESSTEEITQKIGVDLGLKLTGDIFAVPPVEAVAPAFNLSLVAKSDGSALEAKFSYEFSRKLLFSKKDVETYSMEKSYTRTEHRKEQCYYLTWQVDERLSIFRVAAGTSKPVYINNYVSAMENRTYTDRFSMSGQ